MFSYYTTTANEFVVQINGRVNLDTGNTCHAYPTLEQAVSVFDTMQEQLS